MSADPRVGIVTPCRNRREKTARFLDCIFAQDYSNFRMYLVDSNSTDGTPETVHRCYPGVELLRADDSKFWTGATNIGVRRALQDGCDFVLTINDDSLIGSDWLRIMVEEALAHGCDILGSRIDFLHSPGLLWALRASNDWAAGKLFQLPDNGIWADESLLLRKGRNGLLQSETLCGNGVLFRRSVFEKVGLYDEHWLPHYHADSEFVLRARKHGFLPFVTTRAVVCNDVFNDGAAPSPAPVEPPVVRPGDWRSLKARFAHDGRKLFLSIRSDLYWRAVLAYVWRHCPRGLLFRCIQSLSRLLWQRYFEAHWQVFRRATQPKGKADPSPVRETVRLWRHPLSATRAPALRGEFTMEVITAADNADRPETFLETAYRGILGRDPDADAVGFSELAATPQGRDAVLDALTGSLEARFLQLHKRVTPLAARMLDWRRNGRRATPPQKLHLSEDIERLAALRGQEMVDGAYRELLGRSPEPGAIRMQLQAATESTQRLVAALLLSAEYKIQERGKASPLVQRWTNWALTRRSEHPAGVRDVPVQSLANTAGK